MPQVFVRALDGKTRAVDVEDSATVADLRRALNRQHGFPDRAWTFRVGSGGSLSDDTQLSTLGFSPSPTFLMGPPPVSAIRDGVVVLLHRHLQELLQNLSDKHFVFIGVGSYDNDHGLASVKRQQCRDAMFDWCERNGWRLSIVLIDPAFVLPDTAPQIYSVNAKGWSGLPVWTTDDDLVRQYINGVHPLASVWTFATGIKEYDPLRSITDPTSIHGLDFRSAFENAVRARRLQRCCLVMGNFYNDPTDPTQYTTVGDFSTLQACGFVPTG